MANSKRPVSIPGSLGVRLPANLLQAATTPGTGSLNARDLGLTKGTTLGNARANTGLTFGHVPRQKKGTSTSGSNWQKFLGQAVTGGVGSILGASTGASGLGSLTSIFSDLASLFSSKKTQPALTAFSLPAAQNQSIEVGSSGSSGGVLQQSANLQDQNAQVAQAVKTALLHSSSLNDVIGEL